MAVLRFCNFDLSFSVPGLVPTLTEFVYVDAANDTQDLEYSQGPIALDNSEALAAFWKEISLGNSSSNLSADGVFTLSLKKCAYNLQYAIIRWQDSNGVQQYVNYDLTKSSCDFDFDGAIKRGCTDNEALNYNATATEDDGSCVYEPLSPQAIFAALVAEYNKGIVRMKRFGDQGDCCCNDAKTKYLNYISALAQKVYGREVEVSPAVPATAVLSFNSFNVNLLYDGMNIEVIIEKLDGSTELLTSFTANLFGLEISDLTAIISFHINLDSDGYSSTEDGGNITVIAPADKGDSLNGASLSVKLADVFELSEAIQLGNADTGLGYPTCDDATNSYFPDQGTASQGRTFALTNQKVISSLLKCYTGIDDTVANWVLFVPKLPYKSYFKENLSLPVIATTEMLVVNDPLQWNHNYMYVQTAVGYISVYDNNGVLVDTLVLDSPKGSGTIAISAICINYNASNRSIHISDANSNRYCVLFHTALATYTFTITAPSLNGGTPVSVYNPFNGCSYIAVYDKLFKFSNIGALIATSSLPSIGLNAVTVNPITGDMYLSKKDTGSTNLVVINCTTNSITSNVTLPFSAIGRIGIKNNGGIITLFVCENATNDINELDTSFAIVNTYSSINPFTVVSDTLRGCYYDPINNVLFIATSDGSFNSHNFVYDLTSGKIIKVFTPDGVYSSLSSNFNIALNSFGDYYLVTAVSGFVYKYSFKNITDVTHLLVVGNGRYVKAYNVNAARQFICSPLLFDIGDTVSSIFAIYKADTKDIVILGPDNSLFILNVTNFGTGYVTSNNFQRDTYLYQVNNHPTLTTGIQNPRSGVYMPSGDVVIIGDTYLPATEGFGVIPANKSSFVSKTTGTDRIVSVAVNNESALLYVLYVTGKVEVFDDTYTSIGSYFLPTVAFTYGQVYTYYESSYKILVIVDSATGDVIVTTPALLRWEKILNVSSLLTGAVITKMTSNTNAGKVYISYIQGSNVGVVVLALIDSGNYNIQSSFDGGVDAVTVVDADECIPFEMMDEMIEIGTELIKKCK